MQAYILCGGFGTRLRSVIADTQKALAPVHGQPFLLLVLRQLKRAGLTHAVLCAHYRADQLAEQLSALAAESGMVLSLVVEDQPLGTGGALLNALHQSPPTGPYLTLNADTYLDADAYRLAMQASGCALVAAVTEDRSRYGSLQVNAQGHLQALLEKGLTGAGLINAGVYAFAQHTWRERAVEACSMEQQLLPELLQREPVEVCQYAGRFIDIGTPQSFALFASTYTVDSSP